MSKKERASRMSLTMSAATKQALEMLAEEHGVSVASIMKLFLERGLTEEAIVAKGGRIVAQSPDGREYILVDQNGDFITRPGRLRLDG